MRKVTYYQYQLTCLLIYIYILKSTYFILKYKRYKFILNQTIIKLY
jgi:hypothetical protein